MQKISLRLSVVSPVFQAENIIDELILRLVQSISAITDRFEIVLVDDGSSDGSWRKIEENCERDSRIRGIRLSRNFGQHAAIAAGLESARGEWIVVMDCDLQDRPEEIPALYRKALEGYDIVLARRLQRQDHRFKHFTSKLFYRLLSFLSGSKYDSSIANFGIYQREIIAHMLQIHGSIRYFPSMVNWVGFHQTTIDVEHASRPRGKSSYNFIKRLALALNIMLTYGDKPLRLIVGIGALISAMAFIFAIVIAYRAYQNQISVLGYSSLIISISFFSGAIISILGILGLYIGKIFDSIKTKPAYLVRKRIND